MSWFFCCSENITVAFQLTGRRLLMCLTVRYCKPILFIRYPVAFWGAGNQSDWMNVVCRRHYLHLKLLLCRWCCHFNCTLSHPLHSPCLPFPSFGGPGSMQTISLISAPMFIAIRCPRKSLHSAYYQWALNNEVYLQFFLAVYNYKGSIRDPIRVINCVFRLKFLEF